MLKRIASTGVNLVVLGVSVGIFLVAFIALNALGAAQKPPTISVLSATRDLNIGDVITPMTWPSRPSFRMTMPACIFPVRKSPVLSAGWLPNRSSTDSPSFVLRSWRKPRKAHGSRQCLQNIPGYSLFPLPLDAMNLVAPDADAFLPGDLVGVTMVITSRPQQMTTPTAMPEVIIELWIMNAAAATPAPQEIAQTDALSRALPPLAKDLFPMGVRVISVQGLPPKPTRPIRATRTPPSPPFDQPHMLILLVPNASREVLSLALQQGDRLVVSLMARGDETPTAGFTYWDFEDLFKSDREEVLGGGQ